jgi:raffinose/stachyose/melibiose transport system permease protein
VGGGTPLGFASAHAVRSKVVRGGALVALYTAQGRPLTIFVMTQLMRQIPTELKQAARIDGANEYQVFWLILPLMRPVTATVAVFLIVPVWNDLWFPLILAQAGNVRTVTLGAQQFIGSFATDWQAVLAALTLALIPPLVFYSAFSRQLLKRLTAGALRGRSLSSCRMRQLHL